MPSKTFLNLNEDKKNKLINSAINEFSTNDFPNVSINKIIANADIPRGSFYMYFENKEDLLQYIIEINRQKLDTLVKHSLRKYQGNLEETFIYLYDELIKKIKNHNIILYKNIFFYLNLRREKFSHPGHLLFTLVKDEIDTTKIKSENLEFVFTLFMHNLFSSLGFALKEKDNPETRYNYLKQLDILCYGIYKEEN